MIRSTILTVFLSLLVLSVKASPLPDPLPEALPQDGLVDQSLEACPPPPDDYQPPPGGESKPLDDDAKKKQEQEEAQRRKKEELRLRKEKMRERQEAERAKKESKGGGKGGGGGGGGGKEGGGKGSGKEGGGKGGGGNGGGGKEGGGKEGGGKGGGGQEGGGKGGGGGGQGGADRPISTQPPPVQQGGGNQGGKQGGGGGGESSTSPPENPPQKPAGNTSPIGNKVFRGPATFYGGALEGGNCMMKGYQLPPGVSGAAIGGKNWDNSANCGTCAEVRGNGKKVIVMFVDQCSECDDGLDFFPDGFKQLADPSVGKFTVEWNFVQCPVQGPIKITDKEGTNEYYVAMQVQNGKEGTASLELSSDKGKTYKPTQRDSTNHFILNGGPVGAQSVDVKVTSKSGKVVVVPDVPISGGGKQGPKNYDG